MECYLDIIPKELIELVMSYLGYQDMSRFNFEVYNLNWVRVYLARYSHLPIRYYYNKQGIQVEHVGKRMKIKISICIT